MNAELNILKLAAPTQAKPVKQAAPAPRQQEQEGQDEFSSVLRQVSKESQDRPQAQPSQKEANSNSENGLAAGKEENLAGEEGSSRSASLSPNKPDEVTSDASQPASLDESGQAEVLVANAGGELPFLNAIAELFAKQTPEELRVSDGEALEAFLAPQVQAKPEAALVDASELFEVATEAKAPVEAVSVSALDEALALLEPVTEEVSLPENFVLPKPVAQKQTAQVAEDAAPAIEAPVVENAKPQFEIADSTKQEADKDAQASRREFTQDPNRAREEEAADDRKTGSVRRPDAQKLFRATTKVESEESLKPSENLFESLSASARQSAAEVSQFDALAATGSKEQAGEADFGRFLREMEGIDRTREPKAPEQAAPVASHRPLPGSIEDQVFRQIRMKLEPGLSQVDIRLQPPELGAVRIRFEMEGDRMTARVEAKEAATAVMLERNLPELKSTLAQAGFDVKEFEITTSAASFGLGFQEQGTNEAENEARQKSGRSSSRRDREAEEAGREGGELLVSRAGGGIDYVI